MLPIPDSMPRYVDLQQNWGFDMRKLNFILLHVWAALAFAVASKPQINKFQGEWLKLLLRIAGQQPLPIDLGHFLLAFNPGGRWLHTAAVLLA